MPGSLSATPYSPPPARGKARILFKNGRQQGSTTHPRLEGNDRVVLGGAFQKLDVRRSGKEIVVNGRGTANDDSEGSGFGREPPPAWSRIRGKRGGATGSWEASGATSAIPWIPTTTSRSG